MDIIAIPVNCVTDGIVVECLAYTSISRERSSVADWVFITVENSECDNITCFCEFDVVVRPIVCQWFACSVALFWVDVELARYTANRIPMYGCCVAPSGIGVGLLVV